MCNFLTAIVMLNGDIICYPQFTDGYEDLLDTVSTYNKPIQQDEFVQVEFSPSNLSAQGNSTIFDMATWTLKIRQSDIPDWFNKVSVYSNLADRVRKMFVQDRRKILLGGCYILGDGADIEIVKNARIFRMVGDAKVERVYGISQVGWMSNTSKIERIYGSAKVEWMYDSAKVVEMSGLSKIGGMAGSSQVEVMFGQSHVGSRFGLSKIVEDRRNKKLNFSGKTEGKNGTHDRPKTTATTGI